MASRLIFAALIALAVPVPATHADEVIYRFGPVTCSATNPNVTRMRIDGLRFGLSLRRAWAEGRMHLVMRDRSQRHFAMRASADLIDKTLPRNETRSFVSYAGIECTANHRNIKSVHSCQNSGTGKQCEVGMEFWGGRHAYLVSVTFERIRLARQLSP